MTRGGHAIYAARFAKFLILTARKREGVELSESCSSRAQEFHDNS